MTAEPPGKRLDRWRQDDGWRAALRPSSESLMTPCACWRRRSSPGIRPSPQGVVADAVGVKQSTITNVLKGHQTSVVTLAMIARVVMPMVSANDGRRLQNILTLVETFMRKPRPTPPTTR